MDGAVVAAVPVSSLALLDIFVVVAIVSNRAGGGPTAWLCGRRKRRKKGRRNRSTVAGTRTILILLDWNPRFVVAVAVEVVVVIVVVIVSVRFVCHQSSCCVVGCCRRSLL